MAPEPTAKRIAITGATGLIGSALTAHFRRQGHRVQRITRHPREDDDIGWGPREGRLDPADLEGVDAVVHLAGENLNQRWSDDAKERIRASRTEGTRLLAETLALLHDKPDVLVCASAVGFYGDRGDELLNEDSGPGSGFLSGVVTAWEAAADPARRAGLRVAHLRQGIVLSHRGGALKEMLAPFRFGVGGTVGSGRQYWSWVSLHDVVRAYTFVLDRDDLEGAFNLTAPNPARSRDFVKTLGDVLNRPTVLPLPGAAVKLMFGQMGEETLLEGQCVVPDRLAGAGFRFDHTDLKDGLTWAVRNEADDPAAEATPTPA